MSIISGSRDKYSNLEAIHNNPLSKAAIVLGTKIIFEYNFDSNIKNMNL